MRVAILDDYGDTLRTLRCFDRLAGHDVVVFTDHTDDVDVLASRLAEAEALVLIRERTAITAQLLDRLPQLRLISLRSVYPHVDVAHAAARGVTVCSNLHAGTPSFAAAELTWALVLAGARQLPQQVASMRAGHWQTAVGRTLRGSRLGVYGFGRIGATVAGYGAAFGMDVVVWAAGPASRERAAAAGYPVERDRARFFAESDVVTLHQRLVDTTRHTVTYDDLTRMGPRSLFVNTSRAGLVAPGALTAALDSGRPGAAALDVFDHEPVTDPNDDLLRRSNVICTPHLGYVTREEWELQFADVFDQINAFAAGAPINVVNPPAR